MDRNKFSISTELEIKFDDAVTQTITCLKDEGFGVLTEIDVKETFKEKLGIDFKRYRILGACNPSLAYKVLSEEEKIGLFLPCNVIVYEIPEGKIKVAAVDPVEAMSIVGNDAIRPIAEEVRQKLLSVISALEKSLQSEM